jgi:hypothetical protein
VAPFFSLLFSLFFPLFRAGKDNLNTVVKLPRESFIIVVNWLGCFHHEPSLQYMNDSVKEDFESSFQPFYDDVFFTDDGVIDYDDECMSRLDRKD